MKIKNESTIYIFCAIAVFVVWMIVVWISESLEENSIAKNSRKNSGTTNISSKEKSDDEASESMIDIKGEKCNIVILREEKIGTNEYITEYERIYKGVVADYVQEFELIYTINENTGKWTIKESCNDNYIVLKDGRYKVQYEDIVIVLEVEDGKMYSKSMSYVKYDRSKISLFGDDIPIEPKYNWTIDGGEVTFSYGTEDKISNNKKLQLATFAIDMGINHLDVYIVIYYNTFYIQVNGELIKMETIYQRIYE